MKMKNSQTEQVVFSDLSGNIPNPKKIGVVVIGLADTTQDVWITQAAKVLTESQVSWPKDTQAVIAYSGYDDDPRELWQVEMPARKLAKFSQALWFAGFPKSRLESTSILLLMACDTTSKIFEAGAGHA
jgi:hypothetical protein